MDIRKCIDSFWLTMLHPWLSQEIPLSSNKSRKPFHNPRPPLSSPTLGPSFHQTFRLNTMNGCIKTFWVHMFQTGSQNDIIYRKRQQTVEFLSNSKFGGTNLKPRKNSLPKVKILKVVNPPLESWLNGAPKTPLNLICFKASGWSKSILGRLIYKRSTMNIYNAR